ncbi:hypothetical protein MGH68_13375 [Erysipelothrix sp. D19-032]
MKQSTKFGLGIAFATGLTVVAGSFAYYQLRDSKRLKTNVRPKKPLIIFKKNMVKKSWKANVSKF